MELDPPPRLVKALDSSYEPYVRALVGSTGSITSEMFLEGLRTGLVPMVVPAEFLAEPGQAVGIGWWNPDPRGVLMLDDFRVSRSLGKSFRRFECSVDQAFDDVVAACKSQPRPGAWIDDRIMSVYAELHASGQAHSVEVWNSETGQLAGGIFGVGINGVFSGESMFHAESNASKVALAALVCLLRDAGHTFLDVQWLTEHLASLAATEISQRTYRQLLVAARDLRPTPLLATTARSRVAVAQDRRLSLQSLS